MRSLSGYHIRGECRCSVSGSPLDDPEQQTSLQTGYSAEFAILHSSEEQVRNQLRLWDSSPLAHISCLPLSHFAVISPIDLHLY